ncbi:MAG: AAA family ATPase [Clostridiales bacterium]|nr:AAA family ATPase [Clostridiales bacterium]
MPVKITEFQAENVKRVKAVQIAPAANGLTILGGGNNQGKTSVLDAIAWALGGDKYRPTGAKRDESNTDPHMRVELSNGIVVERRGKNAALTVTDTTGKRAGQNLLNTFVEQLAIDLPRFMNASDREKADTLLKIIGVGDQLAVIDRDIKAAYDKRTAIGQIAEQKKHYADEMIAYPEAPNELVSASELIRQQQDILACNGENQRKRDNAFRLQAQRNALAEKVNLLREELDRLTAQLIQADGDMETAFKTAETLQDESTAELEASLQNIEDINRKVRANADKDRAEAEATEYSNQYNSLTGDIEQMRKSRTALLDGADLPLPGLGVENGALTYDGHVWGDMSGSEQLRVATAIVRKLNPDCGFVLLDKLEQMDIATLQEFGAWLESEGLQAIATRVSTGGECQIVIEDGRVAGQSTGDDPAPVGDFMKGAF